MSCFIQSVFSDEIKRRYAQLAQWLCGEINAMSINELTSKVIGAAIEVHKALGPGLLESAYEECLCHELDLRKILYKRQKEIPIEYKGIKLDIGYRLDLLVDNELIVELKACELIEKIHEAQLLTYLKLTNIEFGLLINFNTPLLKDGLKRLINTKENEKLK
ncbi:GxxExxY protein [Thermodesulfobacteriota bacterium]